MAKVVNKRQLAEFLGVTERALTDWQDEGLPILKKGERGQENAYDAPTVVRWYIEREVKRAARETQRDRLLRLQADRLEREEQERKRELIPASEIAPTWKHLARTFAAYFLGQHSRLAGILEATPGVDAKRKVLRTEFAEGLTRLGHDGFRLMDEMEGFLEKVSEAEAKAFLKRISGDEPNPSTTGGRDGGAGGDPAA